MKIKEKGFLTREADKVRGPGESIQPLTAMKGGKNPLRPIPSEKIRVPKGARKAGQVRGKKTSGRRELGKKLPVLRNIGQ